MQHPLREVFKVLIIFTIVSSFILRSVELLAYENCETPDYEEGECRMLSSCISLKELAVRKPLTNAARSYLRNSHCDTIKGRAWVCCPLSDISNRNDNGNARTTRSVNNVSQQHSTRGSVSTKAEQIQLPHPKEGFCGKLPRPFENRIVGGEETYLGEFPWFAVLIYEGRGKSEFGCGGVIITKRHILTAAHCVIKELIPKNYNLKRVRLGEWDRTTEPDCQEFDGVEVCADNSYDFMIQSSIPHENYDYRSFNKLDDIALLKLEKNIKFSDFIRPICVQSSSFFNGDVGTATVIGFGRTEDARGSDRMRKTDLNFLSHRECSDLYRQQKRTITESQVCAKKPGSDSCNGDSGGPLLIQVPGSPSYWQVVGVVSYGPSKCGYSELPGIYTRVDKYVSWIQNKIKT